MISPAEPSAESLGDSAWKATHARRWGIVALLFMASMINYFDRATISFALPLISKELHLDPTAKGILLSAFFWSYALMQIPMGLCADRLDLRWLYAGAFTLWSLAQGLTGFATTLGMLIGFRVILGIGEAIYLPGGTKVVSLLFPLSERGLPCGLFDFGTRTGLVLEGLVVPWMLQRYGWRTTFAVIGFTALVWLIPWMKYAPRGLRVTPTEKKGAFRLSLIADFCELSASYPKLITGCLSSLAGGCAAYLWRPTVAGIGQVPFAGVITRGAGLSAEQKNLLPAAQSSFDLLAAGLVLGAAVGVVLGILLGRKPAARRVVEGSDLLAARKRYRNLFGICLGFFCFDYYWYLLVTWLPDYLVTVRQLTILKAGIYASLPFLVFGVSQPLGGWIADRLVRAGWDETRTRKGIITVAFLTGLLLIPAALVKSADAALVLFILGCLVGLSTANMLVILQGCAPQEEVGVWVGVYNFVGNIAGILAPIITGIVIQVSGSYTPAFVLAAVMIAAGQLSFWFIVGRLKPAE